jgi:outer membrane receptor protein involved in Fe transport
VVHAPDERRVHRFSVSRRIAQLDFGDFISAANFSDGDIDRGNPNLTPQQTWLAEWSSEARFGDIGTAQFRAFHRWISDVQDRLPVDDRFEVPGNIGDGRRWGVALEGTLPLDAVLRVGRSRLDLAGRWEDSSVTDPVTGRKRPLSGRRKFEIEGEFRQDLIGEGWAWGLESGYEDARVVYELDEIDIDERGVDFAAFVETTRFFGVKMQLIAQNLLDRRFERSRRVFDGARGTDELSFEEIRDRRRGRSLLLSISGSF